MRSWARMPAAEAERRVEGKSGMADFASLDAKLVWLGREMVKNYGCYSCHELKTDGDLVWADMEGIGVELTGAQPWGIKHWDRLDFGYLADDGLAHHGATFKHQFTGEPVSKSVHKTRQEWLYHKLENPRVYDGGKMDSKPWDELLRMPHFAFTPWEIERLQTFVLSFTDYEVAGLVENVKHRPEAKDQWMARGERIARDNNCAGCHRLSLDRFEVEWTRRDPKKDKVVSSWEWAEAKAEKATTEQAEPQLRRWGLLTEGRKADQFEVYRLTPAVHHRTLEMPAFAATAQFAVFDGRDWSLLDVDEKGKEIVRPVRRRMGQDGGDVIPHIAEFKRELNRAYVKGREKAEEDLQKRIDELKKTDSKKAKELEDNFDDIIDKQFPGGELFKQDPGQYEVRFPPMLRTQGVKTQADWTFRFLKNPWPIRPNIHPVKPGAPTMPDRNIRMPNFGLTDEEAASLVRWFAARDHVQGVDVYPHTPVPHKDEGLLAKRQAVHAKLLPVVKDNQKGCAQCHWVNGQAPPGDPYKHAPELGNVEERIRPRWLKSWVEAPATVFPGAVMLPAGEVVPGFKEMNREQKDDTLEGLVEILMNLKRLDAKPTGKAN
ncbi:MAG TPA: hypothetical protein VEJ18_09860 [Planctomycetota bacterium]|nr:hypothetical protein [Planctomycetota bacterium]